jgi:nitrate/nitrite transporter NarK
MERLLDCMHPSWGREGIFSRGMVRDVSSNVVVPWVMVRGGSGIGYHFEAEIAMPSTMILTVLFLSPAKNDADNDHGLLHNVTKAHHVSFVSIA